MDTTYRLIVLGDRGMYTYGETAETPELARLAVGHLLRRTDRLRQLGIERTEWGLDEDGRPIALRTVLVEAEAQPGEWTIGV